MTAIESSTTPTRTLAESIDSVEDDVAQPTVSANAPSIANSSAAAGTLSSLENIVSKSQAQLGVTSKVNPNSTVQILESVITLVGLLASIVKTFLGNTSPTGSSSPREPTKSGSSSAKKPTDSTSAGGDSGATAKKGKDAPKGEVASSRSSLFDVAKSDAGDITVRSLDGYIVRAEGKEQAWSISGPEGKTTRIWGDPHVTESDGDRWDFRERGTFIFGNNKATVEVIPAANGETLSSRLTLYSGDQRVTISGIDKDKPVITAVLQDGKQHDDSLADGTQYRRTVGKNGEGWKVNTRSRGTQMGR